MKLLSCHIENFGILSGFDHKFSEGINEIFLENGTGKSTLAAFLRVMFYGFDNENTRKSDVFKDRKHYAPWKGGVFGGSIKFETKGRTYELTRLFDTSEGDVFELRDAEKNTIVSDFSENIGEECFKIDRDAFAKTVFIDGSFTETSVTPSISAKMGNLESVDADLKNYGVAEKTVKDLKNSLSPTRKTGLAKKLKEEVTALTISVKDADVVMKDIDRLRHLFEEEEKRAKALSLDHKALEEEKNRCLEYERLKALSDSYEKILASYGERKAAKDAALSKLPYPEVGEEDIDDALEKLSKLNETKRLISVKKAKLEGLLSVPSPVVPDAKKKNTVLTSGFIVSALFFILSFIRTPYFASLTVGACAIALLSAFLVMCRKERMLIAKKEEYDAPIRALKDETDKDLDVLKREESEALGVLRKLGMENAENGERELADLRLDIRTYLNCLKESESAENEKIRFERSPQYETLKNNRPEAPKRTLSEVNDAISANEEKTEAVRKLLKEYDLSLEEKTEQMDNINSRMLLIREKTDEMKLSEKRYKLLEKAEEHLVSAKEGLEVNYIKPMKDLFDKYYSLLSDEDAEKYKFDVNGRMSVTESGAQRDIRGLSEGYRDMTSFCTRMAMIDLMYKEDKPFLVFDHPFKNLDDRHVELAKDFLKKVSADYQILYFICRKTDSITD